MEIYISPQGNDAADGTLSHPLGSFQGAAAYIRKNRASGEPATVHVRGGVYRCRDALELTGEENITFAAYADERPVLSGGVRIPAEAFVPVTDAAILERVGDGSWLLETDLTGLGIQPVALEAFGIGENPAGGLPVLRRDNERLAMARWPKDGFCRTEAVSDTQDSFLLPEAAAWSGDEAWVYGYPMWEWADCALPVRKIQRTDGRVFLDGKSYFGMGNGKPVCFFNILETMVPGEFYISSARQKLYICGPAADAELSASVQPLVRLTGASSIVFSGITFEMTRGNGVECVGGENNSFQDCTFRDIGKTAAVFGYAQRGAGLDLGEIGENGDGGRQNGLKRCTIHDIGMGGVSLSGGDRQTLRPCGNYVRDCRIFTYAKTARTYRPAAGLFGVGCIAAGNTIHDGTHMGIGFEGNDHLIEGNEIYDVCQFSDDAGAVYSLRDWTFCGNVIRKNYIHDIQPGLDKHGTFGIYLDDGMGSTEIYANLFERVPCAVMTHGGGHITIRHNVIKDGQKAFELRKNHPDLVENSRRILTERLAQIDYHAVCWQEKYPWLAAMVETGDPMDPKDVRAEENLLIHTPLGLVQEPVEKYGRVLENTIIIE